MVQFIKIMFFASALVAAISCLPGCNNPDSTPTDKKDTVTHYSLPKVSEQLPGNWWGIIDGITSIEVWQKVNDTLLHGDGYMLKGVDTIMHEKIALVQKGNDLYYIPSVNNQNGGDEVIFKCTNKNDTQMVFENPEHDFPQKITYIFINKDSVLASISGNVKGKLRTENFPMSRKTKNE